MSGEKRTPIQILQDEMRSNRNELHSIKKHRQKLQAELKKVRIANASKVKELKVQMDKRAEKQAVVVNGLKSDMKEMAKEHNKQLTKQRKLIMDDMQDLEARMDENIENLRDWTQDRLEEQRTEYRRILREQQQQINVLKRDIEQINQREENREQRAKDYITDLEALIESAEENLPHEKYAEGKLDRIKRQLDAAKVQLGEDVPSATIATVQRAHFDLMDLEEEILLKEAEYEMTYRTVADAVGGLFSSVRENRNIQLEDDATLQEADYWTDGNYQELEDRIEKLKNHIDEYKNILTTEELNGFLDDLEKLTKEQERLVSEAVERIISSQMRAEMGDSVVSTLEAQGYRIKDGECGYAEDDQRGSYMIKLSNVAGTEVVTLISPDEKTYENVISINTYNEEVYDDESKKKRNNDILRALKEGGLQLGETECHEQSLEELYDVKNLIKKGGKKLPKKVLRQAKSLSSNSQKNPTTS